METETRHSSELDKISAALVEAQGEVHNALKDSKNPHYNSDFASLESNIDAVRPVFNRHGLAVLQFPGWAVVDGRAYAKLTTRVVHTSGQWLECTAGSPLQKQDPQGIGSALTYLRRYSLAAVACIAQTDDDGEAASRPPAPKPAEPAKPYTKKQLQEVTGMIRSLQLHRDDFEGNVPAGIDKLAAALESEAWDTLRRGESWIREHFAEIGIAEEAA